MRSKLVKPWILLLVVHDKEQCLTVHSTRNVDDLCPLAAEGGIKKNTNLIKEMCPVFQLLTSKGIRRTVVSLYLNRTNIGTLPPVISSHIRRRYSDQCKAKYYVFINKRVIPHMIKPTKREKNYNKIQTRCKSYELNP